VKYNLSLKLDKPLENFDFVFLGIETKKGELLYREDFTEKNKTDFNIIFSSKSEPHYLILWPYKNQWEEKQTFLIRDNVKIKIKNLLQKFYHSGDLGDVIYSLPTIKRLGGGILYISPDYTDMSIRDPMTLRKTKELKLILKEQEYIKEVYFTEKKPEDIDIDLNRFRKPIITWIENGYDIDELNVFRKKPLAKLYEEEFNLNDTYIHPFLKSKISTVFSDKPIVINRSERYLNRKFPWRKIIEEYREKIIFIGLKNEYKKFVKEIGEVEYFYTKTYIEAFRVISGCKLFIGNQSFCYSLAEGLKKNCIQETSEDVCNSQYFRHNSYISRDGYEYNYNSIKNFIDSYI